MERKKYTGKRFKSIMFFIISCIVIMATTKTVHASGPQIELNPSQTSIYQGEELRVTFCISGLGSMKTGINVMKGKIEYDSSVIQEIQQEDFTAANSWKNFMYHKETGEFIVVSSEDVRQYEDIFTVKVKVKQKTDKSALRLLIKDCQVSEGKQDINLPDNQTEVEIKKKNQELPDDTKADEGNAESGGTTPKTDNMSRKSHKLISPKTEDGSDRTSLVPAMLSCGGILILLLLWYKISQKKVIRKLKRAKMLLLFITVFLFTESTVWAAVTGDCNGDGALDESDILLLEQHLIHQKELIGEGVKAADLNADQAVTVTDLSLLLRLVWREDSGEEAAKGAIVVSFKEKYTERTLAEDMVCSGLALKEHTIDGKDIPGYRIIGELFQKVTITEEEPEAHIIFYYIDKDTYLIELDKFNISCDGQTRESNAGGITDAIHYAKAEGYQRVLFPEGIYSIQAPQPIVIDSKDLKIDLNGATIKMQDEQHETQWNMIELREPAENLAITNGVLQGNRFSEEFDSQNPYNEWTVPIALMGGNQITLDGLVIKDAPGYGMFLGPGLNQALNSTAVWANEFESGSLSDTGEPVSDSTKMRSNKMYDLSKFGNEFELGYTAGYQGYPSIHYRQYEACFYDENGGFLLKRTQEQYVKDTIPQGSKYVKFVINQSGISDYNEGSAFITNATPLRNSTIKNCTFEANRALGLAFCGGQNVTVENNSFTRNGIEIDGNGPINPAAAIDLEDGWECMQNITIRKNDFSENRFDLISCAGDNLLVEENNFTNGCAVYARTTNYNIVNNTFRGGSQLFEVSVGGSVHNNSYIDTSLRIGYRSFSYEEQSYLLDIQDETFQNTDTYAHPGEDPKYTGDQIIRNSRFLSTDDSAEPFFLKGTYDGCTFETARMYNSAALENCVLTDTNSYSQANSRYQNCEMKTSTVSTTTSSEAIKLEGCWLENVSFLAETWANPVTLTIAGSTITNRQTENESAPDLLRLSAGKSKEISLTGNVITLEGDMIQFYDTTYSPPQGSILLADNQITVPEAGYAITGQEINSGSYTIESRNNTMLQGNLLNPVYQNCPFLTLLLDTIQ